VHVVLPQHGGVGGRATEMVREGHQQGTVDGERCRLGKLRVLAGIRLIYYVLQETKSGLKLAASFHLKTSQGKELDKRDFCK